MSETSRRLIIIKRNPNREVIGIYTITEVAKICGVTSQALNKRIRNFTEEETQKYIVDYNAKENKKKHISEQGLQYFKLVYGVSNDSVNDSTTKVKDYDNSNEVVTALLEQLKQKDIQLAEKDKQIDMLMEQARNYQVLLQAQQMLSLPPPKKSFIKRLFVRKELENDEK